MWVKEMRRELRGWWKCQDCKKLFLFDRTPPAQILKGCTLYMIPDTAAPDWQKKIVYGYWLYCGDCK